MDASDASLGVTPEAFLLIPLRLGTGVRVGKLQSCFWEMHRVHGKPPVHFALRRRHWRHERKPYLPRAFLMRGISDIRELSCLDAVMSR